jgi:signal transduction histidine kinase
MAVPEAFPSTDGLAERVGRLASFNRHVVHDLRAPLVSVAGVTQLARQALARGDALVAGEMLALVSSRTESALKLLGDLMALAETDGPLLQSHVDLGALAEGAIEQARWQVPAGAGVRVVLQPLPQVRGVAALLRQVYVNLVANALKFSAGVNAAVVEVGVDDAADGRVLYVRDNGVGFDAAGAGRLFEPFARLHGSAYAGHGLGLSLVKQVVERHGGRVWAEPRVPAGAAFRFTLDGLD